MNSNVDYSVLDRHRAQTTACETCQNRSQCSIFELAAAQPEIRVSMKVFRAYETVVQAGEQFNGLYMVRSGFFKSTFIDNNGEQQVTGFHFPGEIFGIEGLAADHYDDTTVALDSGSLCQIPLALFTKPVAAPSAAISAAANKMPMLTLVRFMSAAITYHRSNLFHLGKMDAKRRLATFLLDVSKRMSGSNYRRDDFRLCMSRIDIANHLSLALETVSRLFGQLVSEGFLAVDRREVHILDHAALTMLAQVQPEGRLLQRAC